MDGTPTYVEVGPRAEAVSLPVHLEAGVPVGMDVSPYITYRPGLAVSLLDEMGEPVPEAPPGDALYQLGPVPPTTGT